MDGIRKPGKKGAQDALPLRFGVARQRQIGHRLQRTARVPAVVSPAMAEPRRRSPPWWRGRRGGVVGGGVRRRWRSPAGASAPPASSPATPAVSPAAPPAASPLRRRPDGQLVGVPGQRPARRATSAPPCRCRATRPIPAAPRSAWPSTATRPPARRSVRCWSTPAGPASPGSTSCPSLVAELPADLLAAFDIVGFDPPGRGPHRPDHLPGQRRSGPVLPYRPGATDAGRFDALVAADRTFAAGCEAQSGAELPYVSTATRPGIWTCCGPPWATASSTYLGFSYGTLLGATYAGLFPTHVRAMVLDGALDPALPAVHRSSTSSRPASTVSCSSSSPACAQRLAVRGSRAANPTAAYEALLAQVRANPLPAAGTSRTVGPSELLYGTAVTLYSTTTWNDLADALQAASQGNGTDLLDLFDAYTGRRAGRQLQQPLRGQRRRQLPGHARPLRWPPLQAAAPAAEAAAPVFGLQNLDSEAGARSGPSRRPDRWRPSGPPVRRRSWWSAAPATRSRRTAGPSRSPAAGQRRAAHPGRRRPHRLRQPARASAPRWTATSSPWPPPPPGTRCPSD